MPSPEATAVLKMNNQLRDAWLADPNYNYDDFRRIFEEWLAQFDIPSDTTFEKSTPTVCRVSGRRRQVPIPSES